MDQPRTQPTLLPDQAALAAFWRAVVRPGEVHEVRVPKTRKHGSLRFFGVASGYFDSEQEFVTALRRITGRDAEGVYITLNPVTPALKARAANRLQDGKPVTTTDADILQRRHLLIDVDPDMPAGISATDAEREIALICRDAIADLLTDVGWPAPLGVLATGNGGGLLYRIDLENTPEAAELVRRVLTAIKHTFEGNGARIDTTVANAARIAKVAGTISAKGDDLLDRPWRLASADLNPDAGVVSAERLTTVAAWSPAANLLSSGAAAFDGDIADRLRRAGVGFREAVKGYATVYKLDRCLSSPDHVDGNCILEFPSGALAYVCHHNRCQGKDWFAVRGQLGYGEPATVVEDLGRFLHEPRTEATPPKSRGPRAGEKQVTFEPLPIPEAAISGWFQDYLDLVAPTTEASDAFHVGAALTLVSSMIGRRIRTEYASDPLFANIYTVLIGPSGSSRKDTAIKRAMGLPHLQLSKEFISPDFHVLTDVGSAQGMLQVLKTNPVLLLYFSEFSVPMRNARRKETSTILPRLTEAWDTPPILRNTTKLDSIEVRNPYLTLIAATQPGTLADEMTAEDIHSGFANRHIWIPGVGKEPMATPPPMDKQRAWHMYLALKAQIKEYGEEAVLPVNPACDQVWNDWYHKHLAESGQSEDEDAMRVRHATIARKLALIIAVTEGAREILPDHLTTAITFLEWMWSNLRIMLREWGVSRDKRIEERILAALAKHPHTSRRHLQQVTNSRHWSARDFAATFKAMAENGTIVMDRETGLVSLGQA